MAEERKSTNKRIIYFLIFLVIVLPVITGVLVWKLLPGCDEDENGGKSGDNTGQQQTTSSPGETGSTSTTPDPFGDGPWRNLRLPDTVRPVHYELTLFPDFYDNEETFYGNVTIKLSVNKQTNVIMVHVLYLNISDTQLFAENEDSIEIVRTFEYKRHQFWVVETKQPLTSGTTVQLKIQFSGSLTRSIVGFYKSTYTNFLTNQRSSIATTKFEPVNARRAFPCMDEPNIKANYTVTLVHKSGYTALSNMPAQSNSSWSSNPSYQATKFEASVEMSTYLVCFIVCDFKYLEKNSSTGIKVRLYAPPDRVNQTRYALEVAITTVDLYTKMFNVSYPLPKLDLISIPDFVSGAMENWGLITFRETNILFDPLQASDHNKQRVATVVAHEVSHQWFGNLVTMDWWQDLWLNEGFASFMEYLGADKHEPTWKMPSQFLADDLQGVMVTDAGLSSHPIVVDVTDPSEINAVFDSISYSKGSSVIRMLERWMGSDKFFSGISKYLKKYQFKNARTDDLWAELGEISQGLSVKSVMDTWTKQMGLPVVSINISGTTVTATQQRFLADNTIQYDASVSPYGYTWFIKLDYKTGSDVNNSVWMKRDRVVTFSVADLTNAKAWIKFNSDETGFYRVNYPDSMWRTLSSVLNCHRTQLSPSDRSNLLDDVFNLARAGLVGYDIALDMTSYLDKEDQYLPWDAASSGMSYISKMLEFTGDYGLLQEYKVKKVSDQYNKLTWADTGDHLKTFLQSIILSLACGNGHEECLQLASQKFHSWLYNDTSISPNLRSLVYTYGMRSSGSSLDWDRMWTRYQNEAIVQEKSKLMSALAQTRSIPLLMRYIEYAKNESNVRSQDYFTVLTYMARNPVGRSLVWDWVRNNWQYLVDRFTLYSRYFGRLIPAVISNFNTEYQLEEVKTFFAKYPDAGAGAAGRKQALESISRNINWMKTNKDVVVAWLQTQSHVQSLVCN